MPCAGSHSGQPPRNASISISATGGGAANGTQLRMRVVERGPRRRALVDRHQQVRRARRSMVLAPIAPCLDGRVEHARSQIGHRVHVLGPVNHHLLPVEGRKLVRHNSHRPARLVRPTTATPAVGRQLRRRQPLVTLAERARHGVLRCGRYGPVAPGRPARPGTISTRSPVSGFRRSAGAMPVRPSAAGRRAGSGRSGPGRSSC